jgi:hypothetical protein
MGDMSSITRDIENRRRVNETLEAFYAMPSWTPAMGSMLLSGALPLAGCTEIPETANALENPTISARPWVMGRARQVLERWLEHCRDVADDDAEAPFPATVAPFDFLYWCSEEYADWPDSMRPPWLRYWTSFAGFDKYSQVPGPAPADLVARAAALETFWALHNPKPSGSVAQTEFVEPEWIAQVGRPGDLIAEKIRDAIREVWKSRPELGKTRDDAALHSEAWMCFAAWAREAAYEISANPKLAASKKHYPLAGIEGHKVFFDPALRTSGMGLVAFKKRIDPDLRGKKRPPEGT